METASRGSAPIRIGTLAAATGVSVQAVRYYERRGLISPAGRRTSGYREYAPDTIEAVRFIRHAQQMGFKLEEIGELLRLRGRVAGGRTRGADSVRAAVQAKRDDVVRRMEQLEAIRTTLDGLLDVCDRLCTGGATPEECPIFEVIDHADPPGSIAPAGRAGGTSGRARPAAHHHQP